MANDVGEPCSQSKPPVPNYAMYHTNPMFVDPCPVLCNTPEDPMSYPPNTNDCVVPIPDPCEVPNPFLNEYKWTAYNIFKTVVCAIFLVPLRMLIIFFAIVIIAIIGASSFCFWNPNRTTKHMPPAFVRKPIAFSLRLLLLAGGVWHLSVTDERADKTQVPPIIVGNHISWLDILFMGYYFTPSVVAMASIAKTPVFNVLARLAQVIYVDREDPESRAKTRQAILDRVTTPGYPPLLIFPEGMCTNGSVLVTFKTGAFNPGVPVLPVVLEYPYKYYNPSCRGAGSNPMMLTLQFVNHMKATILEPYIPTEEDVKSPELFAFHVREAIRSRLGVPATRGLEEDGKWIALAKENKATMG